MIVSMKMASEKWDGKKAVKHEWEIKPIGDITAAEWRREFVPRLRPEVAKAGLVAYRRAYPDMHALYRDGQFWCVRDGAECLRHVGGSVAAQMGGADIHKPGFCVLPGSSDAPRRTPPRVTTVEETTGIGF